MAPAQPVVQRLTAHRAGGQGHRRSRAVARRTGERPRAGRDGLRGDLRPGLILVDTPRVGHPLAIYLAELDGQGITGRTKKRTVTCENVSRAQADTTEMALPRLGSRVRIPSSAPKNPLFRRGFSLTGFPTSRRRCRGEGRSCRRSECAIRSSCPRSTPAVCSQASPHRLGYVELVQNRRGALRLPGGGRPHPRVRGNGPQEPGGDLRPDLRPRTTRSRSRPATRASPAAGSRTSSTRRLGSRRGARSRRSAPTSRRSRSLVSRSAVADGRFSERRTSSAVGSNLGSHSQ